MAPSHYSYYIIATALVAIFTAAKACPPSDRAALLAFRAALHEPYLGIFKSWTGPDCCKNWYGVTCDHITHRVADISLRGISEEPIFQEAHRTGFMTGSISSEICKLDHLSGLTLSDWKGISSGIPTCLATHLPSLRFLELAGNRIAGRIPAKIGRLRQLAVLNLADNSLTGPIPQSIVNLQHLKHLDLRNNKIYGEIPSQIGRLRMLSRALLSGNRISGKIPGSVSNLNRISDLDLSMNRISGHLPDIFHKLPVISTLSLDGNLIAGQIPPSLLRSSVSMLNLSMNALEGRIPDVFGPRSYFMLLDLAHNKLTGPIPKSIKSVSYIGHLDLSYNRLCGEIPDGPAFDHLQASCFTHNSCLCGKPLGKC